MTALKSGSEPTAALRRIRLAGLLAALAAALLLAFAGEAIRRPLFDAWQRLSPRDLSDTHVHVVAIDPESLRALGGWPWPRFYMARLTEEISRRGAVAIGFDIIFAEPDPLRPDVVAGLYPELDPDAAARLRSLPPADDTLARVMGEAPTVLARAGVHSGGGDPATLPVETEFKGPLPPALDRYRQALVSIPQLEDSARGFGVISVAPDPDGVFRKVPLIAELGRQPFPGLSLELVRIAREVERIGTGRRAVSLAGQSVPVNRRGELQLRFGAFPPSAVTSAVDLLRRGVPADRLKGKVVLVGLAAEGAEDVVTTPIEREQFGIFVHAQATDALLRGRGWLERPIWAAAVEWAVGLALVLLVLFLLPRRGPLQYAVPVASILVLGLAWLAFDRGDFLLDPLRPLLLGGAAAAGVGLAALGEARRERERLREDLIQQRITAAEAEKEMEMARSIQLGMLPPAAELAGLDPRIELAAVLEPARSVGGDFYDAIRLGPDRIAFSIADVTGKGVPASLFMALAKALSKSVLLREANLEAGATLLNEELSRDNVDMGVTMVVGVIDLASGELAMVNAGHEDPFLARPGGQVATVPMEGGPPFCIVDYPWPIERLTLAPGETLILVTDGITEAQDGDGALFGRERTAAAIAAVSRSDSAGEIAAGLVRSVRAFEAGAEPSDDLTVLVLKYQGFDSPGLL